EPVFICIYNSAAACLTQTARGCRGRGPSSRPPASLISRYVNGFSLYIYIYIYINVCPPAVGSRRQSLCPHCSWAVVSGITSGGGPSPARAARTTHVGHSDNTLSFETFRPNTKTLDSKKTFSF
ncbi:unnamed protein product, partial [Ixodes persulcatus]